MNERKIFNQRTVSLIFLNQRKQEYKNDNRNDCECALMASQDWLELEKKSKKTEPDMLKGLVLLEFLSEVINKEPRKNFEVTSSSYFERASDDFRTAVTKVSGNPEYREDPYTGAIRQTLENEPHRIFEPRVTVNLFYSYLLLTIVNSCDSVYQVEGKLEEEL